MRLWLKQFNKAHEIDIIHIIFDVLILLCVYSYLRCTIGKELLVDDIIDLTAITSVIIAFIFDFIANGLAWLIANRREDREKLTEDYSALVEQYSDDRERMLHDADPAGQEAVLPVIVDAWTYGKEFAIEDCGDEYQLPGVVANHFDELFGAHATSDVYNNTNIRMDGWEAVQDRFVMHTSRTTYFSSLVTNRAMDYKLSNGITIRDLFECGPAMHAPADSNLSNHLGFNGFVISSDGFIVLVKRSGRTSIGKRTVGDSIGASLKTKYALNHGDFSVDGLVNGIIREIRDELNIEESELEPFTPATNIIAAYRDYVEGGKPQLFFVARAKIDRATMQRQFDAAVQRQDNSELRRDGDLLIWIPESDIEEVGISTDRIHYRGSVYPMVPSAVAGFIIYKKYLKERDAS